MLEIFGPVPSRRLGHSLGINNIPPKHCSYSCIYCQLGSALHMSVQTETFFPPKNLADAVERKLEEVNDSGATVDYLTIVPDGEPTLDRNLGELIMLLKRFPVPVAIISNGTLVVQDDVHDALLLADWVSLKVDAITEKVWWTVHIRCSTMGRSFPVWNDFPRISKRSQIKSWLRRPCWLKM